MLTLAPNVKNFIHHTGTKRLSRAVRATRKDGEVFRWTDHDAPVIVKVSDSPVTYETFTPDLSPSFASRAESGNFDAATTSLSSFLHSDAVSVEDLRIGLWRSAPFEVFTIDWRYPWAGFVELRKYWVGETRWTGNYTEIELAGLSKQLDVKIGRVHSRECDAKLGDGRCTKDLTGFTSGTRTITAMDPLSTSGSDPHPRLVFESTNTIEDDDFWKQGHLSWLSGPNAIPGANDYIVKISKKSAGYMELWTPTPYDIEVGHTFVAIAGCMKRLIEDCKGKFANEPNHRGFGQMVNPDLILKTPAAKS